MKHIKLFESFTPNETSEISVANRTRLILSFFRQAGFVAFGRVSGNRPTVYNSEKCYVNGYDFIRICGIADRDEANVLRSEFKTGRFKSYVEGVSDIVRVFSSPGGQPMFDQDLGHTNIAPIPGSERFEFVIYKKMY